MSTSFEDTVEPDDVAFNLDVRILNEVSYTSLGGQIHYNVEIVFSKELIH